MGWYSQLCSALIWIIVLVNGKFKEMQENLKLRPNAEKQMQVGIFCNLFIKILLWWGSKYEPKCLVIFLGQIFISFEIRVFCKKY